MLPTLSQTNKALRGQATHSDTSSKQTAEWAQTQVGVKSKSAPFPLKWYCPKNLPCNRELKNKRNEKGDRGLVRRKIGIQSKERNVSTGVTVKMDRK